MSRLCGPRAPVAVIGEALADMFDDACVVGGAPFNVARTLAACQVPTRFISRVGCDAVALDIQAELQRFGLNLHDVQRDGTYPTGVVRVHQAAHGALSHRFDILTDQAYDHIDPQMALQALGDEDPPLVCFGTLAMRQATSQAAVTAVVQRSAGPRLLDINLRDTAREPERSKQVAEHALQLATVLKVNDEELPQLLDWFIRPGEACPAFEQPAFKAAVADLMRRFNLQGVLLTRGALGSAWYGADGQTPVVASAPPAHVVDTVGAGDAFTAVFVLGHLLDWPMPLRLQRANHMAAAVCGLRGAVSADLGFYRHWCMRWAEEDASQQESAA